MARKSRKNSVINNTKEKPMRIFNAALYIRLSNEGNEKRGNRNSLKTQKALLMDFVEAHPDISVYKVYEDNGYTGTNFDRPGFSDMMYDVSNEKVDCIIVKDLSRFGREHIEMGKYLDYLFPMIGLRFIAINDNYDTYDKIKDNDMIIPFKNIINSVYAKDISRKVISSKRTLEKKGVCLAPTPPYGYLFDENRKLIINPEVSHIVQRIFKEYAEGKPLIKICRDLSDDGIDTPRVYKYKKGMIKGGKHLGDNLWKAQPLISLITNPVYAGNITNCRSKSLFLETGEKKRQYLDKENWIVVENTHEAIIDKELFDAVQQRYDSSRRVIKKNYKKDILVSKLKCGECGHSMKVNKGKTQKTGRYNCTLRGFYPDRCSNHSFNVKEINDAVLKSIKKFASAAIDFNVAIKEYENDYKTRQRRQILENNIKTLNTQLSNVKKQRFELFNDCINSIIDAEEFKYAREEYATKVNDLEFQIQSATKELEDFVHLLEPNEWIEKFKHYKSSRSLTKEMIDCFIDKILLYNDNRIEIKWNFSVDEFNKGEI